MFFTLLVQICSALQSFPSVDCIDVDIWQTTLNTWACTSDRDKQLQTDRLVNNLTTENSVPISMQNPFILYDLLLLLLLLILLLIKSNCQKTIFTMQFFPSPQLREVILLPKIPGNSTSDWFCCADNTPATTTSTLEYSWYLVLIYFAI